MKSGLSKRNCCHDGSARAGVFLVVITLALLWAGGQKLLTALTNRKPAVMSYEEFARTKPTAAWLVITNCRLDLTRACYKSYAGDKNPTQLYIAVCAPDLSSKSVRMLLKTSDPALLGTMRELENVKSDTEAEAWGRKNWERLFPRRNITGVVCFGIDLSSNERSDLSRAVKGLSDDFVILESDAQPSLAAGLSLSAAGLAVLCAMVISVMRK
jgi:hypothetical protein